MKNRERNVYILNGCGNIQIETKRSLYRYVTGCEGQGRESAARNIRAADEAE